MLNTIIAHRVSPYNLLCDLLSTFLLLNLFRLAKTRVLNTYWLKTFQLSIFIHLLMFCFEKHTSTLTLWGNVCDKKKSNFNPFSNQAVTQQNVEKVKRCERTVTLCVALNLYSVDMNPLSTVKGKVCCSILGQLTLSYVILCCTWPYNREIVHMW